MGSARRGTFGGARLHDLVIDVVTLTPDQLKTLDTLLVGGGGGIIGSLATEWLKTKLKLGVESKHKRKEDAAKKLRDRLDPDLNVRREYTTSYMSHGSHRNRKWLVNPFWIAYEDGEPSLRGWNHKLMEVGPGRSDGQGGIVREADVSLVPARVVQARERREWLAMWEDRDGELRFHQTEAATAADACLFQPLPVKPRSIAPWRRGG